MINRQGWPWPAELSPDRKKLKLTHRSKQWWWEILSGGAKSQLVGRMVEAESLIISCIVFVATSKFKSDQWKTKPITLLFYNHETWPYYYYIIEGGLAFLFLSLSCMLCVASSSHLSFAYFSHTPLANFFWQGLGLVGQFAWQKGWNNKRGRFTL